MLITAKGSFFKKTSFARSVVFFFASVAFVLIFSSSTSPLYPQFWGDDSAIFQVIGKGWTMGYLPYVDLFDHKGPLIFLIDAIGYAIGSIWIIEAVFLFFTLWGVYDILSNSVSSEKWKIVLSLCSIPILFNYYEESNLTEEYCLPFLIWSMSKQLSYTKSTHIEHKLSFALLYGITFGVCLMTRVTNAVIVCSFVLVISIHLARKKAWRNLGANALAFLAGAAIIVIPFILYFSAHNALPDMFYGTIWYNISYMEESFTMPTGMISLRRIISLIVHYFILISMAISVGIEIKNKNAVLAAGIAISAILSAYVCLGGQGYLHYGMILLPYYPLFIDTFSDFRGKETLKKLLLYSYCIVFVISLAWNIHLYNKNLASVRLDHALPIEILSEIPKEDHDSIVGYNMNADTYLTWDIMPRYTYFTLQDWQGGKSEELMEKIHKEYETCDVKWIIAPEGQNGIDDILNDSYFLKKSYNVSGRVWNLFCLKV